MYAYLIGIVLGIPITIGGQLFLKTAKEALKLRKEKEKEEAKKVIKLMVEELNKERR